MLRHFGGLGRVVFRRLSIEANNNQAWSEASTAQAYEDNVKAPKGSFSKNHVELIGGVVSNPVVRKAKNGGSYTVLNLATTSGDQVDYHNIMVFGKLVDIVMANTKKGDRLYVSGYLRYYAGQPDSEGKRGPRITQIQASTVAQFMRMKGKEPTGDEHESSEDHQSEKA